MLRYIIIFLCGTMFFHEVAKAQKAGDTTECEVSGTISKLAGKVVMVDIGMPDILPAKGVTGELSKPFEKEMFGGIVKGWMTIGEMQVAGIENNILSLTLLRELSEITVNGEKKNHFETGSEVKFVWKVPVPADEIAFQKGEAVYEEDIFKALQYYRKAIYLNPQHDRALNMTGMAMLELNFPDSALYYFQWAFAVNPKSGPYAKNLCIISSKYGHKQRSLDYAEKAVQCDTSDAEAYYLRGLMYYMTQEHPLSGVHQKTILSDLDKAVMHAPAEPFYRSERAFLRYEFGDSGGACDDAKKAKALGAEDGDELIETYCN